ncbi:MAG: ATP-dependent helicase RecG [Acidimicrobiia bacterium]|nr:ATP-dependent helicase RecG [Acidimicrobiia bacterium]
MVGTGARLRPIEPLFTATVGAMALFKRSSGSGTRAMHQGKLQDKYANLAESTIADAPMRVPVRVSGEVQRQRLVPRAGSPVLEIVLSDGTADAFALFTGRRSLGGLHHGRGVMLEGVAHTEHGRRVFMNPSYTLL